MKENKFVRICRGQKNIEVKNNMIKDEHAEFQQIRVFILGLKGGSTRSNVPLICRIRPQGSRAKIYRGLDALWRSYKNFKN